MLKYTKYTLQKIENLFELSGFKVRYEKGSFKAGYCIVEQSNVVVINKFFDTEARINCLLDMIVSVDLDQSSYNEKQLNYYKKLKKTSVDLSTVVEA